MTYPKCHTSKSQSPNATLVVSELAYPFWFWAPWSFWTVIKKFGLDHGSLEEPWNVHVFLSFDKSLETESNHTENRRKWHLAKLPYRICLAGPFTSHSLQTARGFSHDKPLCVCKSLSCCFIFFNNCFLASCCCTMKTSLYFTFLRDSHNSTFCRSCGFTKR